VGHYEEILAALVLGAGIVERWQLGVGFAVSCLIFFVGVMVFRRTERTFADTI